MRQTGPRRGRRLVRAFSYDYESGHVVARHAHVTDQLLYAASGVMTVTTPLGTWTVPPQRAVWIPARVRHSIRMSGAVRMRTLYLPRELVRDAPRDCCVVDVSPLLRELVLAAVEQGGLDLRRSGDAGMLAVLLDRLRVRPLGAMHLPIPTERRAERVARKLLAQPGDPRSFTELACGSGASRRTIERLFRAETGMSLGMWRRQLRLGRALERLGHGEPVTAVAIDSGYSSVSAFIATFRSALGETPGRYFGDVETSRERPGRRQLVGRARPAGGGSLPRGSRRATATSHPRRA